MNKQRQTLHILLALMITISMVALVGHNYSHTQSDITTCELCIHHGSSNDAIAAETKVIFASPLPHSLVQNHHSTLPANTDLYHQPSRAPPRFS